MKTKTLKVFKDEEQVYSFLYDFDSKGKTIIKENGFENYPLLKNQEAGADYTDFLVLYKSVVYENQMEEFINSVIKPENFVKYWFENWDTEEFQEKFITWLNSKFGIVYWPEYEESISNEKLIIAFT